MNITNMMKDTASGMLGNIEKAVIEIVDKREQTQKQIKEEAVQVKGGRGSLAGGKTTNLDFSKALKKLNGTGSATQTLPEGASRKLFYVQFNPNELSFCGHGGGAMPKSDFSSGKSGMTYEAVAVRITMDVKLIFDQVNVKDAFMADKWTTSPTSMATGAAQLALSAAGKSSYSVQKEVEGFVAALRSMYTRTINFYWGKMQYGGVLHRVSVQYTMFNLQGEPIRGEVHLSITCADQTISETNMGKWEEYYNEAFQGKSQSYVKATQKVGNLLNLNL